MPLASSCLSLVWRRPSLGILTLGAIALAALTGSSPTLALAAQAKPNVIIFYADDLGWGELGCQGSKDIPTPQIDSIAKAGVRFTQGYVAATYCSPSRAGLMTGRYPTRFGHEFNAVARHSGLSLQETTLASRLKTLGYDTICVGKWHLGDQTQYRPMQRGFDEFFGTVGNTPFYQPSHFIDSRVSPEIKAVNDKDFYTTDAYADRAVDWLGKRGDRPWFLYLPFNAQHAPLQAPQKYLDRFKEIKDEKRRIFAAMMSSMDDAVGRVLAQVKQQGQLDNTIIYYIGDNGGPTQSTTSNNGPLRGYKMTTFEGGPRVPYLMQWTNHVPAGKTYDLPVMNLDVLPTVLTAAGSKIDPSWKLDGVDLVPHVNGQNAAAPHETLYWRFGQQWAVRHGDWKLVVSRGGSGRPELYNLAADIGEARDQASAQPDKLQQLQTLYAAWNAEQSAPTAVDKPQNEKAKKKNRANAKNATKGKNKKRQPATSPNQAATESK